MSRNFYVTSARYRNPRAPCCADGTCDKGYPKEFQEQTVVQVDRYPRYRRRQSSPAAKKGAHPVDARDVVPYNPYLSKKYNCHLNVEFCGSIRAVKYLYKYTYKGHDRASVEIGPADEIKQFLDTRYVWPSGSMLAPL